jgi:hypothetical protein
MQNIDLKSLERKAYMSYHQDGLWDIFLGMVLISWGISMGSAFSGLAGVWIVVLFPLFLTAKRWITFPRLGYAEFSRIRQAKTRILILFTLTFLLGLLVMILLTIGGSSGLREWLRSYFEIVFGTVVAGVLCVLAAIHLIKRLYFYAVLVFLVFSGAHWYEFHLKYSFLAVGGIITFLGLVMLIQFMRNYRGRSTILSMVSNRGGSLVPGEGRCLSCTQITT